MAEVAEVVEVVEVGHNYFVTSLAKTVARQILIEHGAEVNQVDDYGWTPLHCAVYYEHPGLVKVHSSHLPLSSFHFAYYSCCLMKMPMSMQLMTMEALLFTLQHSVAM